MPYRPTQITNAFLASAFADDHEIDPMKAQKLTFFAHGYYLAIRGQPLINELFQAWKLGPVVPSLYHRLKIYGGNGIDEYLMEFNYASRKVKPATPPPATDLAFERVKDFVWKTYGKKKSIELSNLTHQVGAAWDRTLKDNPEIQGPQIPNAEIKKDFYDLVSEDERNKYGRGA